jgi:hypothetical protein
MTSSVDPPHAASPARYPEIGVVALDAMAAIAEPASVPTHVSTWAVAFETVVGTMRAAATERRRPAFA